MGQIPWLASFCVSFNITNIAQNVTENISSGYYVAGGYGFWCEKLDFILNENSVIFDNNSWGRVVTLMMYIK